MGTSRNWKMLHLSDEQVVFFNNFFFIVEKSV